MKHKIAWFLAAYVLIALLVCAGIKSYFWPSARPFDSSTWKADHVMRPAMIDDLLSNVPLKGMRRSQIDELLGDPGGPDNRDSIRENHYIYWTGSDGVIDDWWLDLTFEDDQVVDVRHSPD
jgi:hypothetical protein